MKKLTAVLLIAAVALTGAFAADISLGAGFGFGQFSITPDVSGAETVTKGEFPINIDLAVSLEDLPMTFRVDAGTDIFTTKAGDKTKSNASIAINAAVCYRHEFNRKLSLLAGLGIGFDSIDLSGDMEFPGATSFSATEQMFSMFIEAQLRYEAAKHFEIFSGIQLGGNLSDVISTESTVMGVSHSSQQNLAENSTNFRWGINLGAAYRF